MRLLHSQTTHIKHVMQKALVHACSACIRVLIAIKCRYAVLNVRREQDIVRPPAPVQITPELPTSTAGMQTSTLNAIDWAGNIFKQLCIS